MNRDQFIRRLDQHRERLAREQGLAQARHDAKIALNRKDFESVITAYAAFSGSDSDMSCPLAERTALRPQDDTQRP